MPLSQFAGKQAIEFGLAALSASASSRGCSSGRVELVVEEEPRLLQVAHIRIARRAQAAVFLAAVPAFPFAERRGAENDGCALARVFAAANVAAIVKTFDRPGNGHRAQSQNVGIRSSELMGVSSRRGLSPNPPASASGTGCGWPRRTVSASYKRLENRAYRHDPR